jgi:hypothetical protein
MALRNARFAEALFDLLEGSPDAFRRKELISRSVDDGQ